MSFLFRISAATRGSALLIASFFVFIISTEVWFMISMTSFKSWTRFEGIKSTMILFSRGKLNLAASGKANWLAKKPMGPPVSGLWRKSQKRPRKAYTKRHQRTRISSQIDCTDDNHFHPLMSQMSSPFHSSRLVLRLYESSNVECRSLRDHSPLSWQEPHVTRCRSQFEVYEIHTEQNRLYL